MVHTKAGYLHSSQKSFVTQDYIHHGMEVEYLDIAQCQRAWWDGKTPAEHQEYQPQTPSTLFIYLKNLSRHSCIQHIFVH